MYLQNVNGDPLPVVQIAANHVEVKCTFSSGGTAVNVTSPAFNIHHGNGVTGATVTIPAAKLLVPFSKDGSGTGKYRASFLGDTWLPDGDYTFAMTGAFSGGTISNTGIFSARSAGTIQTYIEMLRSALHDYDGIVYLIEDQDKFLVSDGQLYGALNRALNHINDVKPAAYRFALDNCPWPSLLLDFAVVYALHQLMVLSIPNTISYSDEISFTIDRSAKYQSALQVFKASLEQDLRATKMNYAFSRTGFIGMGSTRIPYAISRIFSFIPQASGLFAWGTSIV